jgi:large subunit ribosomal protein L35
VNFEARISQKNEDVYKKHTIMPKLKTKSSAKKRFKVTGTGKIKRKHAFKSHILTKKGTKQKRRLTHSGLVDNADLNSVREQLRLK